MSRDDDVKQALGQVAKLGGFQIKRMATTDDLKDHVITITIIRPSEGWHQERLQFEDELPLTAEVNGRGEVERLTGLQPGDTAETAAEALAEIAAAADPDEVKPAEPALHIEPDGVVAADEESPQLSDPERPKDQPLVGELAAAAKRRR